MTNETLRHVFSAEMRLHRISSDLSVTTAKFFPACWSHGEAQYSPIQMSLQHYLSPVILRNWSIADTVDSRSVSEYKTLHDNYHALLHACKGNCIPRIRNVLIRMVSEVTGRASFLRTGRMQIQSHDGSSSVELPSGNIVHQQFNKIAEYLGRPDSQMPIVRATLLLTSILNAHPFADGNGRLSRMLFNFEMKRARTDLVGYIPIFSAMRHSRGGYEVRLRQAEIFNKWDPLVRYFCRVIDIATSEFKS